MVIFPSSFADTEEGQLLAVSRWGRARGDGGGGVDFLVVQDAPTLQRIQNCGQKWVSDNFMLLILATKEIPIISGTYFNRPKK